MNEKGGGGERERERGGRGWGGKERYKSESWAVKNVGTIIKNQKSIDHEHTHDSEYTADISVAGIVPVSSTLSASFQENCW